MTIEEAAEAIWNANERFDEEVKHAVASYEQFTMENKVDVLIRLKAMILSGDNFERIIGLLACHGFMDLQHRATASPPRENLA
jgi:hypothetical protein